MNSPILNEDPSRNISIEPAHSEPSGSVASSRTIKTTAISATFEQRLLPAPSDMREYEELCPGFTKKYLGLIKTKTQHRISSEKREQAHRHRQQDDELENAIYGFRFCLKFSAGAIGFLIVAAVAFVCLGKNTEAIVSIVLPAFGVVSGIVSHFISRKNRFR